MTCITADTATCPQPTRSSAPPHAWRTQTPRWRIRARQRSAQEAAGRVQSQALRFAHPRARSLAHLDPALTEVDSPQAATS